LPSGERDGAPANDAIRCDRNLPGREADVAYTRPKTHFAARTPDAAADSAVMPMM